ncbi:hypothetical protein [Enterococcus sp. LJL51]|uniref:hypothetical protein n=1 Tax=Enterococcus sp. LJL51 TaxID=3416656 RepID=UPI003CE8CD9D
MKTIIKIALGTLGVIGLLAAGYFLLVLYLFNPAQDSRSEEIFSANDSPSGKYELLQVNTEDEAEVPGYSFNVWEKGSKNTTIYEANDYFRKRDRFILSWGDNEDIIWVYSGDLGLFYWTNEGDSWTKHDFADEIIDSNRIPAELWKDLPNSYKQQYGD